MFKPPGIKRPALSWFSRKVLKGVRPSPPVPALELGVIPVTSGEPFAPIVSSPVTLTPLPNGLTSLPAGLFCHHERGC